MPTKKKKWQDSDPMNREQFIAWCRLSKQRHINIIGEYADEKKIDFKTYGQWKTIIKRYLRPARMLSSFSDDQISGAMKGIEKAQKVDRYLNRWTLETVLKYIEK